MHSHIIGADKKLISLGGKMYGYTTDLFEIDPTKIYIEQINSAQMIDYQKNMSKAIWRPAPGRKLAFLVKHENEILGLIFLASPVINMGERDKYLNLPKEGKGIALRHYMDISVCVGAQPIAWYWNIGKLCAMLATTLGDYFYERYGEELYGLTTTSLYGKGTQYNRVYKFLGYTKGYGHEHVDDEKYKEMLNFLKDNGIEIPSCSFGAGSNARMRRILAYKKASGDKTVNLIHGKKRGIYYHDAIPSQYREQVIMEWYNRWGKPRYDRVKDLTPPYATGLE